MKFFLLYLLIVNAAGFLVMTADKLFARKNLWRVPERTLMGLALIGGSIGVLTAMYAVRQPRYARFADHIIDNNSSVADAAAAIRELIL